MTRPRGSSQINESMYSSDLLLGGSIISKINKNNIFRKLYQLFEVASSGTHNISLRNPVHDICLHIISVMTKITLSKLQKQVFLRDIGCILS